MSLGFVLGSWGVVRREQLGRSGRCTQVRGGRAEVARCAINETSDVAFDSEVLKPDLPVLLAFYAPWCGPCKLLTPILDYLDEEYDGKLKIFKINADDNEKSVSSCQIKGLPTLVLFKEGEMQSQLIGAVARARVIEFLKDNL